MPKNIQALPPAGQCALKILFDSGSHDVTSSFQEAPHLVKILNWATSNAVLRVASLLDTIS